MSEYDCSQMLSYATSSRDRTIVTLRKATRGKARDAASTMYTGRASTPGCGEARLTRVSRSKVSMAGGCGRNTERRRAVSSTTGGEEDVEEEEAPATPRKVRFTCTSHKQQ